MRRAQPETVILGATALVVQVTSGCLSNEYRIPNDEIQRLAQLPPDVRGQHVRIVQDLGSRRGEAIEPEEEPAPASERDTDVELRVDLHGGNWGGGGGGPSGAR